MFHQGSQITQKIIYIPGPDSEIALSPYFETKRSRPPTTASLAKKLMTAVGCDR